MGYRTTSYYSDRAISEIGGMSFNLEYRVAATALSIRAISMSLRAFLENVETISNFASMIELAIAEAMNNVLEHAYAGRNRGEIRIEVQWDEMLLTVCIYDQGEEPNRSRVSTLLPPPEIGDNLPLTSDLECEGRGLYIMESLMDTLDYSRVGDENCLRMTKNLQGNG
jgi:serine/threonine-protein kinase RsbW